MRIDYAKINLLIILFAVGCVSVPTKPNTLEEVLCPLSAYSPEGKILAQKYEKNLRSIFEGVRNEYSYRELEFVKQPRDLKHPGGLGFVRPLVDTDNKYLGVNLGTYNIFNTLQTDFNKRAATVVSKYIKKLLQIVMKEKEVFKDSKVTGVAITLSWWARDFLRSRYFGGKIESVTVFINKKLCKKYLNLEISNQEMINKSLIIGNQGGTDLGKIELDLKQIL